MAKILVKPKDGYELKAFDDFIGVASLENEDYDLLDEKGVLDVATYISKSRTKAGKKIIGFLKELKRGYNFHTEKELFDALESILDKEDYDHYNSYNDRVKAFWVSISKGSSKDSSYDDLKYFLSLGSDIMPYHHYLDILSREEEIVFHPNHKTAIFLKQPLTTFVKMVADKIEEQKNYIQ